MIVKRLFPAAALAFAVSFSGTTAAAQEPANQLTYFTFSAPFELPGGKVLPAGTYTFRIADSLSNRHIVQVLSEDGRTMHATVLAVPAERIKPSDKPEVRFMETPADQPPAIRTWWYPGRVIGHEFIYPREHARRLAAAQKDEGVLTVAGDADTVEEMQTAELTRLDPTGKETPYEAKPAETQAEAAEREQAPGEQAAADASKPVTQPPAEAAGQTPAPSTAQAPPREAPAEQARASQPRTELPQTASLLPLAGLIGFGSLIGAGLLRARRR